MAREKLHFSATIQPTEAGGAPRRVSVVGREAWALLELVEAGVTGCTPITHPGPRWSDYILKLRRDGFKVETINEKHGGPFSGSHARYLLHDVVTLDGGNFFYLAGIWEPAMGGWPLCYRIITVAANPEVARYQDRHGAIIQRREVMQWLDATVPEIDLLVTPPARTFVVEEIGARRTEQAALAF